ncbi:MAG: hypothetical protein O7E49_09670, partial [Gemmatimonadetes bacterium]|nr:hypothetical protein [Gemmatimonadota bacterium]
DAFTSGWHYNLEYAQYPTDEVLSGLNWEGHARVNQRIINYLEGPVANIFERSSRGLRMGNDVAERIRVWAQEDPSTDFNTELATALVFAGYSAVIMADAMCQSVISPDADEPSGTVLEQPEIFAAAMPYLTEAMSVASAAGEDDIANLARMGMARAHLGRAEWSDAATFAMAVPMGFEWWIEYVDIDGGRNPLQNTSHGGNFTLGIHPWFTGTHPSFDGTGFVFEDDDVIAAQTDPRIQHETFDDTGHNGLTRLYKLFQGLRHADYTGETIALASAGCPACTGTSPSDMELFPEFDTNVLLADYVEAQHHLHEAYSMQSTNEAAIQAFVNARRGVGNQAPVVLTGMALRTELRNQRGKDLFMGNFRHGDLRRWTRHDAGNGPFASGSYFPTGQHPNAQWGDYDVWTCYPIPNSEYEGNANLTVPLDPLAPPAI